MRAAIGSVLFEDRIGCFSYPTPQMAEEFIENLVGFFKYMQPLMYNVPLYRLFPTKTWRTYENYADKVLAVAEKYVNKVNEHNV